jgi:hypothetical protein
MAERPYMTERPFMTDRPYHDAGFIPELAKGNCVYRILNQDFPR